MTMDVANVRAWSVTQAGTTDGATATKAAEAGCQHFVTHVSGHVDEDATIQLLTGVTVLAEWKQDVSVDGLSFSFEGLWPGTGGAAVSAATTVSTADCQTNICGYTIP